MRLDYKDATYGNTGTITLDAHVIPRVGECVLCNGNQLLVQQVVYDYVSNAVLLICIQSYTINTSGICF